MMRQLSPFVAVTLSVALAATPLRAGCTSDAMVVFDGSGSMAEMGFNLLAEPRIFDARRAVRQAIPEIAAIRRIGLIVYGPGQGEACANIDLRFAPQSGAGGPIIAAVDTLQPEGPTPLTASVERAAQVLDYRQKPGVVVLVTDGKETCGGSPCQLASTLFADAADLTIHVIGFRVRADYFDWESGEGAAHEEAPTVARCMADTTGGKYVSTETVDDLTAALRETLGCPLIGRLEQQATAG